MLHKPKVLISYKLKPQILLLIEEYSSDVEIFYREDEKEMLAVLPEAEILYGKLTKDYFLQAEKLKWVHVSLAGVDDVLFPELVQSDVILTCSRGIHKYQMAELLFTMIFQFTHKPLLLRNLQSKKRWESSIYRDFEHLSGKTMGIIGLGSVGSHIAQVAKSFGMRVIGLRKHPAAGPNVDVVLTSDQLPQLLRESDFILIILPLTSETKRLIGEKEFALMKKQPYLFNLGRGATIDETALIAALKEGKIKGAGLDVFANEPLGVSSPLWEMGNVIITPHVGGQLRDYMKYPTEIFLENLSRYLRHQRGENGVPPLLNIVDKEKGY